MVTISISGFLFEWIYYDGKVDGKCGSRRFNIKKINV